MGGPARAVIDLCNVLAERGHQMTVATADSNGLPAWNTGHHPNLQVLRPLRLGAIDRRTELDKMRRLLKEHDLVHLHGMWEYANAQIGRLANMYGTPYVISPHGMLDVWSMRHRALKKKVYLRLFGTSLLRKAADVHVTSKAELHQATPYVGTRCGRVIPLVIDLEPFSPAMQTKIVGRPLRVLYLSRIDPKKNIETLLYAAHMLATRGRSISIVVAGSGDAAYVRNIRQLGRSLALDVQFLGMVVGATKAQVYRSCDLFVLPTQHENFGIVYLEALASGLPIVTTPSTGLSQELHDSGGALVVERTAASFADAIETLIVDSAKRLRMSIRGRDWVLRRFDGSVVAEEFERFYSDAMYDSAHADTSDTFSSLAPEAEK